MAMASSSIGMGNGRTRTQEFIDKNPKLLGCTIRIRKVDSDPRYVDQVKAAGLRMNQGTLKISSRSQKIIRVPARFIDSDSDCSERFGTGRLESTKAKKKRSNFWQNNNSRVQALLEQDPKILKTTISISKIDHDPQMAQYHSQVVRNLNRKREDDADSDPDWDDQPGPSVRREVTKTRPGARQNIPKKGSARRATGTGARKGKWAALRTSDEPNFLQENGFDRGLVAKQVVATQESVYNPPNYWYVVEFTDPTPDDPDHVVQEFIRKAVMQATPERERLALEFFVTRLHWMGKIERPDIDALKTGLQREYARLTGNAADNAETASLAPSSGNDEGISIDIDMLGDMEEDILSNQLDHENSSGIVNEEIEENFDDEYGTPNTIQAQDEVELLVELD